MAQSIRAVATGLLCITPQLARDFMAKATQGAAPIDPDAQATVAAALAHQLQCCARPLALRPSVKASAAAAA